MSTSADSAVKTKTPSESKTSRGRAPAIGGQAHNGLARRVSRAVSKGREANMIADDDSERRLNGWMLRMAVGNQKLDLRTNLFLAKGPKRKGKERKWIPYSAIQKEWDEEYQAHVALLPPAYQVLLTKELELGNRDKMGSKSLHLGYFDDGPAKLEAVMSDKRLPPKYDRRAAKNARDRLVSLIPCGSIRLNSIDYALRVERSKGQLHDPEAAGLDPTTNSGPPFGLSRWRPSENMDKDRFEYTEMVFAWIRNRAIEAYNALARGEEVIWDAYTAQRIVNRGPNPLADPKTKRLVIAMEKAEAIMWKLFTPQTMDILRQFEMNGVKVFNAWCDTPVVDIAQQNMLELAAAAKLKVVSGDIAAFDASVIPEIWQYVGDGIASWYYRSSTFVSSLHRSVIQGTRVLSPTGISGPGPSSIKSGSGGTNFDDCMYNLFAQFYGEELGLYKLTATEVQGDDFSALGPSVEPESLSEAFSHCGLVLHPDKQLYEEGVLSYLQRFHIRGAFGGVASTYRVLNSLLVQERARFSREEWNPYTEAIQAIAKLENAAFHPMFEVLVSYVKSHDRYHLGADLPAGEVIKKAGSVASEILGIGSSSFSASTADKRASGFINSPTNRVLRGAILPPLRGKERFSEVYARDRIAKAYAS